MNESVHFMMSTTFAIANIYIYIYVGMKVQSKERIAINIILSIALRSILSYSQA